AEAGHGSDGARAVAGDHEGKATSRDGLAHGLRDRAQHVEGRSELVLERPAAVDDDAFRADRLDERPHARPRPDSLAPEVVWHLDQERLAAHPRSPVSWSTSSSSRRRPIATISPRPTTTSDAATAMTASAKICPSPPPCWRAKAISARFAPLSMISSESSTISGLRRSSTPSAPVEKRKAATARYHVMSGPFIAGCSASGRR